MIDLLDEDIANYSLEDWRTRNLKLYERLALLGLVDTEVVSTRAFSRLTEALISFRVGAAVDPQNASHVRAQNENVIHFALAAHVSKAVLTTSFVAGCFHDLNKAVGEPLRKDEFSVVDGAGRVVPAMTTMAQIVGLNHLGDRTRRTIGALTSGRDASLSSEVAHEIDQCIVHHGLGSSQFIRDLVEGRNAWWGAEFADRSTGQKHLVHPPQPKRSLASLIHDLADSTQQMQGGAAWLMKYPSGFWRASGRSYLEMLTGPGETKSEIPMSLRSQIDVESDTCVSMIEDAYRENVADDALRALLIGALDEATKTSRSWIDDSSENLRDPEGVSVFHDLARDLCVDPADARERLAEAFPGTTEGDLVEEAIWSSARRVERLRARTLALRIEDSV